MFGIFKEKISKEEKMLKYLKLRQNTWVNGWSMVQYVKTLHHTQLISNLRNKGYNIENRTKYNKRTGVTETEYKLNID